MRFSVAAAAALVAGASATTYSNVSTVDTPVYTTEVVTAYTTYCPEPTSVVHNNVTYTITEATTLTITNCPCTITKPLSSATVTPTTTPAAPVIPSAPVYTNATVPPPATSGVASSSVAPAPIASFTAGANKAFAASGAGLAGLLGLAAYIL